MQIQRLDSIAEITMGQAPPGESYNQVGEGLPLIAGAGDFGVSHPASKKFTNAPGKTCIAGDIVLGIRASIGEKVLADGTYCLGRGVAGIRAGPQIDDRYLWQWLTRITPRLIAKAKGATFKQVNRQDIGELPVALPPLPEQRRIAAILDAADALRTKRRATIAKLDELTRSIFLDMFGDPATNPKSLNSVPLGKVATVATGATPSRSVSGYFGGDIPWVKTTEVNGAVIFDTEEKLTPSGLKAIRGKLHPIGSIVIAMYGQGKTRGHAGLLACAAAVNQACAVIHPDTAFESRFLFIQLQLGYGRLRGLGRGGNQENLNLDLVRSFPVLLPDRVQQAAFIQRADAVERTRQRALRSLGAQEALFASLQQRAFRGEL